MSAAAIVHRALQIECLYVERRGWRFRNRYFSHRTIQMMIERGEVIRLDDMVIGLEMWQEFLNDIRVTKQQA